jgi:hypothetical protein
VTVPFIIYLIAEIFKGNSRNKTPYILVRDCPFNYLFDPGNPERKT